MDELDWAHLARQYLRENDGDEFKFLRMVGNNQPANRAFFICITYTDLQKLGRLKTRSDGELEYPTLEGMLDVLTTVKS